MLAAYREWGVDCVTRFRGHVRVRALGRARAARCSSRATASARSRCTTGSIATASPSRRSRRRFSPIRRSSREPDLEALSEYLNYQYVPSPLSAFEGVRKLPPGHCLIVQDGRVTVERYWKLSYAAKRALVGGRGLRGAARAAARSHAPAPHQRRAARRVPERRHRLERGRRADGRADGHAGQDVLDRLRREGVRRAAVRAAGRGALRHRSPRVRRAAGRGRDLPEARLALQRAVRRRVGDPDLLPVGAGAPHVTVALNGDAGRRELRRLPPLHSRRRRRSAFDRLPSRAAQGRRRRRAERCRRPAARIRCCIAAASGCAACRTRPKGATRGA